MSTIRPVPEFSEMTCKTKVYVTVSKFPGDRPKAHHFCYVNSRVLKEYLKLFGLRKRDMKDVIERWALQEFNVSIQLETSLDIKLIKDLIVDRYKKVYPYMTTDAIIDRHGWAGVWVTEQIGRELKTNARATYNRLFKST